jgi:glycosyltransferase involved in cell wall biosynthesis
MLVFFLLLGMIFQQADCFEKKHIVVLACSYNNSQWYRWNLDSIRNQDYDNYHVLYIDDCSSDGTGALVQEYLDEHDMHERVHLVRNKERKGAMYNQYHGIHSYCKDSDIVVICDGDDRLAHSHVLSYINEVYNDPNVWLTYGQFREYPSGALGFCCPMPASVVRNNSFRKFSHIPSHLRTYYAGLFKQVHVEDFMMDGEFLKMAPDIAAMMPMIEMARDHFKFIPHVLLDYNAANVLNEHKISKSVQRSVDLYVRSIKPYEKISSPIRS